MKHFLVVYDHSSGTLLRFTEFARPDDALAARFDAESEFDANPDIEVAFLTSTSEEVLRRTHARYFFSAGELLTDLINSIRDRPSSSRTIIAS